MTTPPARRFPRPRARTRRRGSVLGRRTIYRCLRPGPPFGLANPRPSIRSNVSLRGSCTRRLVTSDRRSFASTPAMPRLSGCPRRAARVARASGATPERVAREPAVARAGSLAAALPPRPNLEGPNPDDPPGRPPTREPPDDSSSGCRTLSCATPSSATLDTRSRCATWAPDRFVTRTAATTGASASR